MIPKDEYIIKLAEAEAEIRRHDDITDICDEFGIEPEFVAFVWMTIQAIKEKPNMPGVPPLGNFIPHNKRECALAVACALAYQPKGKRRR